MRTKIIKLHDDTYDNLDAIREKRESFNDTVERLIDLYSKIETASQILGPSHYLKSPVPPGVKEDK